MLVNTNLPLETNTFKLSFVFFVKLGLEMKTVRNANKINADF